MTTRTGHTQKMILEFLAQRGGAANTWDIQTSLVKYHAGYTKVVSAALYRLEQRGIIKRVGLHEHARGQTLTDREMEALSAARAAHPRASVFWIIADR